MLTPEQEALRQVTEKLRAILKEYDEFMADSFAQQIGVSFADWKLHYKVAAPGEPGQ